MNSKSYYILIIIFLSTFFCTAKSENFYLRMQLVEFTGKYHGAYPETVVFEDTIYFKSRDFQSAFEIGNKLAQERMNKNIKSNKIETYFFEIKNLKDQNIIKYLSDSVIEKFLVENNNRIRIDSISLIID